jgi:hypothetical protein
MAAGQWAVTNSARTKILNGQFDVDSDSFKCALFLSTSNLSAASTTFAGVTNEVGVTNTGYTAGGIAVSPLALAGTTSVTVKFGTNPQWTAGTANLTAKWAALYEVGGDVIAFVTLDSGGADVTATSGNTLTIDGTTNPIFTLA